MILINYSRKGVRKGEELKAPRYASAAALCDDYVTTYNIIPNNIYQLGGVHIVFRGYIIS